MLVEKRVDLSPRRPKGPTHQKARKLKQTLYLSSIDCHLLILRSVKETTDALRSLIVTRRFQAPVHIRGHRKQVQIPSCILVVLVGAQLDLHHQDFKLKEGPSLGETGKSYTLVSFIMPTLSYLISKKGYALCHCVSDFKHPQHS